MDTGGKEVLWLSALTAITKIRMELPNVKLAIPLYPQLPTAQTVGQRFRRMLAFAVSVALS